MTTVHTRPLRPSIPRLEIKPPTIDPARRALLTIPPEALVLTWARNQDAAVYRIGASGLRMQCEGVTAPIVDADAFASLVVAISTGGMRLTDAKRFLGLLPGAFEFTR